MKLGSIRKFDELRAVLKDPKSLGPAEVYWVFSEVSSIWANVTMITPEPLGEEFPKTFGHYNGTPVPELYHLALGEGVLLLQKKTEEENKVSEVLLIKAQPGDEIIIQPEYGHSWSNTSQGVLISLDNWKEGHQPSDYEIIEKNHGMAYYLIKDGESIKALPNPNYQDLPEPVWLTAQEFQNR